MLNDDSCYQAVLTHDKRFDGAFYVGVTSTQVYCRTVCTAKTPHRGNCRFFKTAAAAECAGFRPCLRCRPEMAPGNAIVDSISSLASSVIDRIESGRFESIEALADELGISERHLRRVVQSEFGVSPIELAQTHRLLLAKLLLTDTSLSVTRVAMASGFSSVRQFNATFKERYKMVPSDLRRSPARSKTDRPLVCRLHYRKPMAWKELFAYLAARSIPSVEHVEAKSYARTLSINGHTGWIRITPEMEGDLVQVEISPSLAAVLPAVLDRVKRLFDLNANAQAIEEKLGAIVCKSGLRVPGTFDGFELAVRAVLGQQVSVKAASTLMGRVAKAFGEDLETPFPQLTRLTPTSGRIVKLKVEDLTALGITSARVRTVIALAEAIERKTLDLSNGSPATQIARLKDLPGIGEWTAQYIAMRALKWPDAFPHTDLGVKKAMNETDPKQILLIAEKWQPWRSYAVMQLWHSL